MVSEQLQQQQFRDRIAKLNRKAADFEELRVKPAPINSNMRLYVIVGSIALMAILLGYAGSLALKARSLAQAEAQQNAPIQPVMIKLDKK